MKIAAPHFDDRAEAAIEGASAGGLHHIHTTSKHGVAAEHTGVALGQADFISLQSVHGARKILMPTILRVIRQSLNRSQTLAALDRAQQLAESNLAFAADNVIDAASLFHVGFGSEAGIITAHDDANTGAQRAHQVDHSERSLALKSHDGKANYIRLDFAHQPLNRFAHLVLNQDQVDGSHLVVRAS